MYNVDKMGKFKVPDIRKRNDDALWLQMLKKEPVIYGIEEVLMQYRIRSNSISSNKFKLIKYHWKLYREIEHLSVLRSAFHVAYWCLIKTLQIKERSAMRNVENIGGGKNKLRDNCPVLLNVECSYHGTFRGLSYAA